MGLWFRSRLARSANSNNVLLELKLEISGSTEENWEFSHCDLRFYGGFPSFHRSVGSASARQLGRTFRSSLNYSTCRTAHLSFQSKTGRDRRLNRISRPAQIRNYSRFTTSLVLVIVPHRRKQPLGTRESWIIIPNKSGYYGPAQKATGSWHADGYSTLYALILAAALHQRAETQPAQHQLVESRGTGKWKNFGQRMPLHFLTR